MTSNCITLPNGSKIPKLGLGLWQVKSNEGKEAISYAIDAGYRHFDGAWIYSNEELLGEVICDKVKEGKVKREELFVTSKLWNCFHRPELVEKGLDESLGKLQLDYVDLYLMHWPVSYKPGKIYLSDSDVPEAFDDVDFVETWKAMESLVKKGKVKSIGLSNFNENQIQRVLDNCQIKPANVQVEAHLYLPNRELVAFCNQHGISVTAYSPLGSPGCPWLSDDHKGPMDDPLVLKLASKLGISPGQLLIAYILNRDMICIPKSVKPKRLDENFQALQIKITDEDMASLNAVTTRNRVVAPNVSKTHKDYPFKN